MFDRISVDLDICGGKPCVKGTRIPVTAVLELLEDGVTFDEILTDYYPGLSIEDMKACLQYARNLIQGEEIYFYQETAGHESPGR
jgi:uncharacterized protein (DUF433 family)